MVPSSPDQHRHVHLITPGDHYSPLTGSAVPTVVHGLAQATPEDQPRPGVLVAHGTYADRYDSADIIEYAAAPPMRIGRRLDPLLGRLGRPRPVAARTFAAALRAQHDWEPSVLIAHNAPPAISLVAARHRAVLYAHNQLLRSYSPRESHRVLGGVSTIVCVSSYLANETSERLPPSLRDRIRVVPNGVDVAQFAGDRPVTGDRLHVVFLGRVLADKGPHVLLEAVHGLPADRLQVTIVGRSGFSETDPLTSYERQLRALAEAVPCPVEFASFVPRRELPDLLRSADVLVVPSIWPEPFGLTALEGMAAGAAVIATSAGGLPEAVGDGGILVSPDDAGALAEKLDALMNDRALLSHWQEAGLHRAHQMSWSNIRPTFDAALAGN